MGVAILRELALGYADAVQAAELELGQLALELSETDIGALLQQRLSGREGGVRDPDSVVAFLRVRPHS